MIDAVKITLTNRKKYYPCRVTSDNSVYERWYLTNKRDPVWIANDYGRCEANEVWTIYADDEKTEVIAAARWNGCRYVKIKPADYDYWIK